MDRTDILERTADVIREIFDDDTLEITDDTVAADVEDWDSLEQINILVALEREFGVKFSVNEAGSLNNVGEMIDLIASKL